MSIQTDSVASALPTIERQLAADHESVQEEGISQVDSDRNQRGCAYLLSKHYAEHEHCLLQLKHLALQHDFLPDILPLLPRLVELLRSNSRYAMQLFMPA